MNKKKKFYMYSIIGVTLYTCIILLISLFIKQNPLLDKMNHAEYFNVGETELLSGQLNKKKDKWYAFTIEKMTDLNLSTNHINEGESINICLYYDLGNKNNPTTKTKKCNTQNVNDIIYPGTYYIRVNSNKQDATFEVGISLSDVTKINSYVVTKSDKHHLINDQVYSFAVWTNDYIPRYYTNEPLNLTKLLFTKEDAYATELPVLVDKKVNNELDSLDGNAVYKKLYLFSYDAYLAFRKVAIEIYSNLDDVKNQDYYEISGRVFDHTEIQVSIKNERTNKTQKVNIQLSSNEEATAISEYLSNQYMKGSVLKTNYSFLLSALNQYPKSRWENESLFLRIPTYYSYDIDNNDRYRLQITNIIHHIIGSFLTGEYIHSQINVDDGRLEFYK